MWIKSNGLSCEKLCVDTDEGEYRIIPPRCDWALRIYKGSKSEHVGKCTFIELKGSDLAYACEQILNTIGQFERIFANFKLAKKSFIIASGNIPTTGAQNIQNTFARKTKTVLIVRRFKLTAKFPL